MHRLIRPIIVCCLWICVFCPSIDADPPNFVVILADDLGYSDLGCYGGEIDTRNLDALASNGLRFTQFYNSGRCWPTRASLLTGYYAQQVRRDKLPGIEPSGARGVRPDWAPLLPELLRAAGYRSYHTGKWHIDSTPIAAGFDRSYWLNDQARFFSPQRIFVDDVQQPAISRGTDYYATIDLADQAIGILKKHSQETPDQPFFHYIAFTAPHFPLHALPEDIARYRTRYEVGWDAIRSQRWERMRDLSLNHRLSPVEPGTGAPYLRPEDIEAYGPGEVELPVPWDSLTAEQKRFQTIKMAIHAAMVDRMDKEIGRILEQLREMDAFENTIILFLSDNGCSSELMIRDDGHDPGAEPGSADTHLCLGPGWSTVSNTPFRKHKTWVHEGGIATPLIVHWPAGITAKMEDRTTPGHLIDFAPTFLELADALHVARLDGPALSGKSLVPVFNQDQDLEREPLWWSHENNNAIRVGDWKAVKTAGGPWELYDLASDRTETSDLAMDQPERLQSLVDQWQQMQTRFVEEAHDDP
ncbi:MAG: arylsulfatase [Pirellulaceae bacterium]